MATSNDAGFRARMHALVATDEQLTRAKNLTRAYWEPGRYTGPHFDQLHDAEHPNEITERDLVAVSMLSVTIPPRVAIWLLSERGREQVGELLSRVPPQANLATDGHLLDDDGDLYRLWKLLGRASWPTEDPANGMRTTKTSKLLAAKRPHLVPVYDSVIRELLGPVDNYWAAYRHALDPDGLERWAAATAAAPAEVPLLRRIDALLWMFGTQGVKPGDE